MERQIDPDKTLQTVEPVLARFDQLSEKEFNPEAVKSELEKMSKEDLVELQVKMFSQYHRWLDSS